MRYILNGELYTDADFYVDTDYFQRKEFKEHIWQVNSELYIIELETDDPYYLMDFLEELIVSYRTRTHYWLIPDLYNMTVKILDSVHDDDVKYKYEFMTGNYDGTHLHLIKIKG